jgi:hypothetical protein
MHSVYIFSKIRIARWHGGIVVACIVVNQSIPKRIFVSRRKCRSVAARSDSTVESDL